MAEGDITFYNNFKEQLMLKQVDLDTDTFKLVYLGSGYTFNQDGANPAYADTAITSNEITAANYSAGGHSLTSLTVTQNDASDYAKWDAGDVTISSLGTTTIAHGVVVDDSITAPTADILCFRVEIGTNANGGNYTMSWNAGGIAQLS